MNNNYKLIVVFWLLLIVGGMFFFLGSFILIDPMGIWGSPIMSGINNYKVKQPLNLDLFKPYQYRMIQPDVVFLGSSRIYVGLAPKDYPDKNVKVYNMGMSSLSLKDALSYLHFMIKTHKPAKIFLGLDFLQFNISNAEGKREGFSQKRLDRISSSFFSCFLSKLEETAGMIGLAKNTVIGSIRNSNTQLFAEGWDVKRGESICWDKKAWLHSLASFMKTYNSFALSEKSFVELSEIVSICKKSKIDLKVFFNPISVDLLALLWYSGRFETFENIKQRVAKIVSFKDFACASNVALNNHNFYDASHYNCTTGKQLILSLEATEDTSIKTIKTDTVMDWLKLSKTRLKEEIGGIDFSSLKKALVSYRIGQIEWMYHYLWEHVEKKQ